MSVRLLGPDISSHVRSGHTVDSLAQCVVELVQNSLDASASSVVIRVDTRSWRIQVSDNGEGISQDDFALVGERYATSKCCSMRDLQRPQYFGFRGEALASIVQIARTVELASRHRFSQQTYCKVFQSGRGAGVLPSSVHRSSAGTMVTVHGLFYNLPVRQRLLSASLEMERLQNSLRSAILVFPSISFSLHDEQAGRRLVHAPRTHSLLGRFCQLFGGDRAASLRPAAVEHAGVRISALFSLHAHRSKCLQLVFVSGRRVEDPALHAVVCRLLGPVVVQGQSSSGGGAAQAQGKRHPLYVIKIDGSSMDVDLCLDPAKKYIHFQQQDSVHAALACLISSFLSENHFSVSRCLPAATSCHAELSTGSSRSRAVPDSTSSPSGCAILQPDIRKCSSTTSITSSGAPVHWKAAVDPTSHRSVYVHPASGRTLTPTSSDTLTPASGRTLTPAQCTPASTLHSQPLSMEPTLQAIHSRLITPSQNAPVVRETARLRARPALSRTVTLPALLSHWANPTFSAGEEAVLSVGSCAGPNKPLTQFKFPKATLQHVKVLGQVDRKFIVCLLDTKSVGSPNLLVAIDQHAAHERVRLEGLLEDLYDEHQKVCVAEVEPPLLLSLPRSQERLARLFSAQLAGIGVRLQSSAGRLEACTLPAVLMEREAGERHRGRPAVAASILQEMVCSHLELLQNTCGGLRGLPSSLASVLHSQACHGAIRFGDALSVCECEHLVQSLSLCDLPFQCAHGRPSLAPLVDLSALTTRCPGLSTAFPALERLRLPTRPAN